MKRDPHIVFLLFLPFFRVLGQGVEPAMPVGISIDSSPRGAEVWIGDSLYGMTPCEIPVTVRDTIVFYYPSRMVWNASRAFAAPPYPDRSRGTVHATIPLRVCRGIRGEGSLSDTAFNTPVMRRIRSHIVDEKPSHRLPPPRILLPLGSAIVAGTAAVVLKREADARYDDYLRTGDRAQLRRVKHYDIVSGIALATTEIAFGWLIYLLFRGK
ncbi:MAG: PEGA domain-containing protein [Bacteroidota bacterium]|nr:PEGA domain-containing protein [Bacteroidota bacterium]